MVDFPNYTLEEAICILKNNGKVFYHGQSGTSMEDKPVWIRVKREQVGVTACFGCNTEDKIVKQKWMINGWTEIEDFLKNNVGLQ